MLRWLVSKYILPLAPYWHLKIKQCYIAALLSGAFKMCATCSFRIRTLITVLLGPLLPAYGKEHATHVLPPPGNAETLPGVVVKYY